MSIKYTDKKLPYIDLGNGYQMKLETDESELTEDDKKKAKEELREIPEIVEKGFKELDKLLEDETTLEVPLNNLQFAMKFLRPSKFYGASAFDRIKKYYKFKVKHKKICDNLIPSDVRHVFDQGIIQFLPTRDQDRRRILLLEVGKKWNPSKCPINDIFRAVQICLEAGMLEPATQINGVITILDMDGLSLKQIMSFTPSFAAMVLEWIQDCVAIRLKGVYVVNNTYLFNMLFAIFKPFIREKLRNRIFFLNKDWTAFHTHVGKEYLPEQYGGTLECPLIPGELLGELMATFDNDTECNELYSVLLSVANRIGYDKKEKWDANIDSTILYGLNQ